MFRKGPHLDHLVFRIGEMHTIMASLHTLRASIEGSFFDEQWIEAEMWFNYSTVQT